MPLLLRPLMARWGVRVAGAKGVLVLLLIPTPSLAAQSRCVPETAPPGPQEPIYTAEYSLGADDPPTMEVRLSWDGGDVHRVRLMTDRRTWDCGRRSVGWGITVHPDAAGSWNRLLDSAAARITVPDSLAAEAVGQLFAAFATGYPIAVEASSDRLRIWHNGTIHRAATSVYRADPEVWRVNFCIGEGRAQRLLTIEVTAQAYVRSAILTDPGRRCTSR